VISQLTYLYHQERCSFLLLHLEQQLADEMYMLGLRSLPYLSETKDKEFITQLMENKNQMIFQFRFLKPKKNVRSKIGYGYNLPF
jgi:hypothetical protein